MLMHHNEDSPADDKDWPAVPATRAPRGWQDLRVTNIAVTAHVSDGGSTGPVFRVPEPNSHRTTIASERDPPSVADQPALRHRFKGISGGLPLPRRNVRSEERR